MSIINKIISLENISSSQMPDIFSEETSSSCIFGCIEEIFQKLFFQEILENDERSEYYLKID